MKLVLVRHGETDWNTEGRIQGETNIPLNENGIRVAKETRKTYDELGITYDVVYSSPLQRAMATAEILVGDHHTIISDERIRELGFGKFEGHTYAEVKALGPKCGIYNCFYDSQNYVPGETEEGFEHFIQRIKDFLEELRETYTDNETILAVCHGGVIRGFVAAVTDLPMELFWSYRHHNLCHTTIKWEEGQPFHITDLASYYYDIDGK